MRNHAPLLLTLALTAPATAAETFRLDNGDQISGELLEERDDAIVLEHPILGVVEVPRERLVPEPPPEPEAEPEPDRGLLGTGFMAGWTREASFGVSGSEGNTVNTDLTGGLELKAEDEERRWSWNGRYFFKTEDRGISDNNGRLESRYDWLFPETRWFLFLQPAYDYDQFKSWKHRATISGGPGYDLVKSEPFDLRTTLGLSFQREFMGQKDSVLSAVWGLNSEWRINESHSLSASNRLFPALVNDPGDFRNLSTLTWKIRLSERPRLNLNLGLENEYESDAPPEDEKNDFKYTGTLGVVF